MVIKVEGNSIIYRHYTNHWLAFWKCFSSFACVSSDAAFQEFLYYWMDMWFSQWKRKKIVSANFLFKFQSTSHFLYFCRKNCPSQSSGSSFCIEYEAVLNLLLLSSLFFLCLVVWFFRRECIEICVTFFLPVENRSYHATGYVCISCSFISA